MSLTGTSATAELNGKSIPLKLGMAIAEGTQITTGAETKAKFVEAHSVVVLGENSKWQILPAEASAQGHPVLKLALGNSRIQVDHPEAQKYKFAIPSAVAGVRGTEFFMSASADKEILCVLEGEVLATATDTQEETSLKKGMGWVKDGKGPAKIFQITDQQKFKWLSSTSF
jgi:hypothetical protein